MENKTYKTNIKCEGCLAKVTPYLNESVGEGNWSVNLNDPAKILSILTDSPEGTVKHALEKAGFRGEQI
ncbi:MAG: heavy metal transport/detoxification protein [Cytophagia bacterium]|nr:heavy metal transport/detoxification protein [Cytophagia bacterium]NBW36306.1 heavy metal transport/detoxification protein [Cytophagia bacterium]